MTTKGTLAAGVFATTVTIAVASACLIARGPAVDSAATGERLMYLTSPAVASRVFRPFNALAADVYWIRSIQHYGRDRKSDRTADRFALLQPLLELTTTLDPYFNIAYRFGAIFLANPPPDGPGAQDAAIALLEKGLAANPRRWQYAHDIAFIYYWHRADYETAAAWFERAAALPKAPQWLRPLAASTRLQGGDRAGAARMFTELLNADQAYIRQAAERALAQLDALDTIESLQRAVDAYRGAQGRLPSGWQDLVRAGVLRGVPAERGSGLPFDYDPSTGTVALAQTSPLRPLPPGFGGK